VCKAQAYKHLVEIREKLDAAVESGNASNITACREELLVANAEHERLVAEVVY